MEPDTSIVDAIRSLLEERGWQGLHAADIAERSGAERARVHRLAPSPLAALRLVLRRIDDQVLADGPVDAADPARDRLFEVMMRRYEALVPWRAALRRLTRALPPFAPFAAIGLALAVERSMGAMLEAAGISAAGLAGAARVRGLCLIHADVLRVFLDDDTVDLAGTMKALDQRLRRAEQLAPLLDGFDHLPRSAAKKAGSAMRQDSASDTVSGPSAIH